MVGHLPHLSAVLQHIFLTTETNKHPLIGVYPHPLSLQVEPLSEVLVQPVYHELTQHSKAVVAVVKSPEIFPQISNSLHKLVAALPLAAHQ